MAVSFKTILGICMKAQTVTEDNIALTKNLPWYHNF